MNSQIPVTSRTHGPRDVAEVWTRREAQAAGVSAVRYQFSVRRKMRDEDGRQQERFIAMTIELDA